MALIQVQRGSFLDDSCKIFWEYDDVTGVMERIFTVGKLVDRHVEIKVTNGIANENASKRWPVNEEGEMRFPGLGLTLVFDDTPYNGKTPAHWHLPDGWKISIGCTATLSKIQEQEDRRNAQAERP